MMNLNYAALSAVAQAGIRRSEVTGLPKGWIREEIPRFAYGGGQGGQGGKGGVEVIYYTPKGHRIRTKNEMAKALGDNYDLTAFDFQTGKINHALLHSVMQKAAAAQQVAAQQAAATQAAKLAAAAQRSSYHNSTSSSSHHNNHHSRKGSSSQSSRTNNHNSSSNSVVVNGRGSHMPAAPVVVAPPQIQPDMTLVPPIRQTASIFKQPVTVEKRPTDEERDAPSPKLRPSDLKSTSAEKPRQLFWEKRLAGTLRATCPGEVYEPWNLPEQLTPVGPPGVVSEDSADPPTMVLASISTSLHLNGVPSSSSGKSSSAVGTAVKGQKDAKSMREKDPSVFCEPDQPLIVATNLTQGDVDKAESRVIATRKRLADAMAAMTA